MSGSWTRDEKQMGKIPRRPLGTRKDLAGTQGLGTARKMTLEAGSRDPCLLTLSTFVNVGDSSERPRQSSRRDLAESAKVSFLLDEFGEI